MGHGTPEGGPVGVPADQFQVDPSPSAPLGLTRERARLAQSQAYLKALEYKVASGECFPVDAVLARWQSLIGRFRNRCLVIPSKVAPRLDGAPAGEIHQVVEAEVYEALTELANYRPEDHRQA